MIQHQSLLLHEVQHVEPRYAVLLSVVHFLILQLDAWRQSNRFAVGGDAGTQTAAQLRLRTVRKSAVHDTTSATVLLKEEGAVLILFLVLPDEGGDSAQ